MQFDFVNTILRFAQNYVVTTNRDFTMLKGREVVAIATFNAYMSLQPMSNKILRMLESGDWDSAEYVGFHYASDKLPILKDELLGTTHGDLKCIETGRWNDYGVFVTGWVRRDSYQTEGVDVDA